MRIMNNHHLKVVLDNFIWVLVAFFLLIASIGIDGFFTVENFINMPFHSASLSMMILGMAFCLLSKQMDLSLESTYVIAPAIGILLVTKVVS
jgi:simple sugar transport system permease protein